MFEPIITWFSSHLVQVLLSFITLLFYFALRKIIIPKLESYVELGVIKSKALDKAIAVFSWLYSLLSVAIIMFVWGFDFQWLLAMSSGIIALTGVALFANWSVLSNITAFVILLGHDSYRRGNYIRIIEGDNYIEGVISEINVFNTRLITENREYVSYPNNLLISRPAIINPKTHFNVVGKIQDFKPAEKKADE